MRTCVSKEWYHIVDTSDSLDECLENFALYSSNEELYLRKTMESMRAYQRSRSYNYDKKMLNFFEKCIVKITLLNSAYLLDFSTAQQLVSKLSDITLRKQFTDELIELRDSSSDTHTVINYLSTMKQIIHKARIAIDNSLDVGEIDQTSMGDYGTYYQKGGPHASTYTVQAKNRGQGGYRGNRFQKRGYHNQYRGNKRWYDYNNEEQPINMDSRGDLRWDHKGNPIDLTNSQDTDQASAWYTSGFGDNGRG